MTKRIGEDLGDHFERVIETQIAKGRIRDAGDVLGAALGLLEEHEARLVSLRDALAEGERSGLSAPFDFDAFLASKRMASLAS